jgi:hypothetical protein
MKQSEIEIWNALRIAKNPMRYERQFFADGDNKIIDETSCTDDSKNAHFANDANDTVATDAASSAELAEIVQRGLDALNPQK